MVEVARATLLREGAGHSSCVYTTDQKKIEYAGNRLPVGRVLVNQTSGGAAGAYYNGLPPTCSIGCGSWGNNSISENLSYKHLMNLTILSTIIPGSKSLDPAEAWA